MLGAWYTGPPIPTLTPKELKPIREKMKADGFKMPRVGWCVRMSNGQEICQDNRGYYLIGQPKEKE